MDKLRLRGHTFKYNFRISLNQYIFSNYIISFSLQSMIGKVSYVK